VKLKKVDAVVHIVAHVVDNMSSKFKVGDVCRTLRGHPTDGYAFPKGKIVVISGVVEHQQSYLVRGQSTRFCWIETWLEPADPASKKSGFGKFISRVEKDASV